MFLPLKLLYNNITDQDALDKYFLAAVHTVDEIEKDLPEIMEEIELVESKKGKHYVQYYNVACAFDIETTSFYRSTGTIKPKYIKDKKTGELVRDKDDRSKSAFMYVWQFMLNGYIVMGRTWGEFAKLLKILVKCLKLSEDKRLPIYVHNLGYEFQFMRLYFEIDDFFATDKRTPCRFTIQGGVEFRDSLILSGLALRNLHKSMLCQVFKKEGDLDYKLMRHKRTPLTDEEKLYCIYDVYVLSIFIYEKLINGENINQIPFTKTGYVRNYIRKHCLNSKSGYAQKIRKLTIEPEEYLQLKKTYQGGFTHANPLYVDDTIENVYSKDFTSSYPTVLIAEKYPMGKGRKVRVSETSKHGEDAKAALDKIVSKNYGYMCKIKFTKLEPLIEQDSYISKSKCEDIKGAEVSNGRVYRARELTTYITNVDFEILQKCYKWEDIEISDVYIYHLGYLPKELVSCIIDFYLKKTTLKDVEGEELMYQKFKEMLNSIYGMMCQDPLQDINEYEEDNWTFEKVDLIEGIEKYNNSKKRTTFYPWGVWCCAYARRNLWLSGILPLGDDYIYSDTDSVKYKNPEKYEKHFEEYNKDIIKKIKTGLRHARVNEEYAIPKTKEGKEKPLGVWDDDGHYKRFKTLGAKRYLVETEDGKYKQTIAGLPKSAGIKYFNKQKDPFKVFVAGDKDNALMISPEETGKNLLTYIDDDIDGEVTDYLGVTEKYETRSSIHMENTSFSLSLSVDFLNFVRQMKTIEF